MNVEVFESKKKIESLSLIDRWYINGQVKMKLNSTSQLLKNMKKEFLHLNKKYYKSQQKDCSYFKNSYGLFMFFIKSSN